MKHWFASTVPYAVRVPSQLFFHYALLSCEVNQTDRHLLRETHSFHPTFAISFAVTLLSPERGGQTKQTSPRTLYQDSLDGDTSLSRLLWSSYEDFGPICSTV